MHRVAVVTGANRGIGLAVCRQLAARGLKVILTSRDERKGLAAYEKLRDGRSDVLFHQLDVIDRRSIRNLAAYLDQSFGRLDVLINNAGILERADNSALEVDLDLVRRTIEANTVGALAVSQALIPLMRSNGYGRIVNITSDLASLANMSGGYPAYRISKAGLNVITRMLAAEVRSTNILVNSMSPGWVKTDMGGENAPVTVEEAADNIIWLATLPASGPSGEFFRERKTMPW